MSKRRGVLLVRTVPNVMDYFKCDAESAQKFIDLRAEGHNFAQAALMAGLSDPPDPDEEEQTA